MHMGDMVHSNVWHDSFVFVSWPMHICGITHSYGWHSLCNTLQHTQIHCNALQRTVTHCNTMQHTIGWCGFYYFIRNSLIALLEAPFARFFGKDRFLLKNTLQSTATGLSDCTSGYGDGFRCDLFVFFLHIFMSCVSPTWIIHVTHTNESFCICECVISHMRTSNVTQKKGWCHICEWLCWRVWWWLYEWFISHIFVCCVKHVDESCHTNEWVILIYMNESCHTNEWVILIYLNESCHACEPAMYNEWMGHVTRMNDCTMGWLRWVGCLKIQVSLQNTGLFCRALLQKRPIFLSILLIVATP